MYGELSYVKDRLKELGHRGWWAVAEASGVPMRTIKRIGYNETTNPTYSTVGRLAEYFRSKEKRRK